MALSDATTSGQSGPGSYGNEEVLHIPQNSSTTGAALGGVLSFFWDAVGVFYSPVDWNTITWKDVQMLWVHAVEYYYVFSTISTFKHHTYSHIFSFPHLIQL